MKILIDQDPIHEALPAAKNFPEFCEKMMGLLLTRNLSIGSCELDGVLVTDTVEAERLFHSCEVCKIASVPLAAALESALQGVCADALRLEQGASELVTKVLIGDPADIAVRWHAICESIKALVQFLPRLSGILTEKQIDQLASLELKQLESIMHSLHESFTKGDTLEISDAVELNLVPWLRKLSAFFEASLKFAETLHR